MQLLISNDDGIFSPGLCTLARQAARFGQVRVVAPDVEQSSMSHAITHGRPLRARRTPLPEARELEAWRVNGTPADCVTYGIARWGRVDLVLSGINLGSNLGNEMWHSGTLAAAKQAALLGMRAIALSAMIGDGDAPDFELLRPFVDRVLGLLLPADELTLVNVNFPEQPRGLRWTRQSVRHYQAEAMPVRDPSGHEHSWITTRPVEETEEGTDRWTVQQGLVSLTPLRLDLTAPQELETARGRHPLRD